MKNFESYFKIYFMSGSKLKKVPASECSIRFYSGYKGYEIPRVLIINKKEYPIDKIITAERTLNTETEEIMDIFICRAGRKKIKIIVKESGLYEVFFYDQKD